MRISHRYKFVFVSIPRTGSTSVRNCLKPYSDIFSCGDRFSPYYHHIWARDLKHHFQEQAWEWDSFFKFAFVRNPWDRLVSLYHFGKPDRKLRYTWDLARWDPSTALSFEDWIIALAQARQKPRFLRQVDQITDANGMLLLDFVGRLENINRDAKKVFERIGIREEVPVVNRTEHRHYSEYYTGRALSLVQEFCRTDIEMFGYRFEKPTTCRCALRRIRDKASAFLSGRRSREASARASRDAGRA
ncbi:MAG: sulfotransferase family 2 domain-containing protein [Planctomycetota bacterium]